MQKIVFLIKAWLCGVCEICKEKTEYGTVNVEFIFEN